MAISSKQNELPVLYAGIEKHVPVMAEFFDRPETLAEYAERLYTFSVHPIHRDRQEAIAGAIADYTNRVFGKRVLVRQPLALNIVDHHAPLTHPILLSTNIAAHAHELLDSRGAPIVSLSNAIVPPNNFLNKKGLHLHGKLISFFSNKEIHQPAYLIPRHDFHFIEKLKKTGVWQSFDEREQAFLLAIEPDIEALDFSRARDYADQVGILNQFLWKRLFSADIRSRVSDLYYVPSEEIFRENIAVVLQKDTILYRVLFDAELRERVLEAFEGIAGCWSKERNKGTHFFWYRTDANEPGALRLHGDALVSDDAVMRIPLDPEEIISRVEKKMLIPNLFFLYGWIVFWCGVRPLTGYGSSTYLSKMKDAWLRVLPPGDESKRIADIDTKGLIGGEILTYARNLEHQLVPQYALDVLYASGLSEAYLKRILAMKLSDLIRPALPDIYKSYIPQNEQLPITLTAEDMMGDAFDWIG